VLLKRWYMRSRLQGVTFQKTVMSIVTALIPSVRNYFSLIPSSPQPPLSLSSQNAPDRLWCTPSLVVNGYRRIFPRKVKRPGREAYDSTSHSAKFKNEWHCNFTSPVCLCSVHNRPLTFLIFCRYRFSYLSNP
jgi:hypothetical protein